MRKLVVLSFLFLSSYITAIAQKGQVAGSLTDSTGKKPVPYATVTVFEAADTSIVTYRLSDDQGKFKVPGLPIDRPLRVVITATGYEVWRKEFTLHADSAQLNLGQLRMNIQLKELDEVLVIAERPPVVFRKDTIEFNANAFKTLPSALVEDLLRKFPGVEVDASGNITVNGRKANRMLVDSKEFFGTDPKVASRNLPANIIDRVQITDDKEQMDRNPDLPLSETGVVINLKLKKSIKKGMFGKLYAGAGTDSRYETGGILNMFRDTLQVSLLGFTNNINRTAFSIDDVMRIGGFSRMGINSMSISSDGGFSFNDINFGGMGQGISKALGAGVNANTVFKGGSTMSLQYFYGQNNNHVGQKTNIDQFFGDTTLNIFTNAMGTTRDYSHRISGSLKWIIDSLSDLTFRPSLLLTDSRSDRTQASVSGSNFEPQLNESNNQQRAKIDATSYSQELGYSRRFKKKGRTLFANLNLNLANNDGNQYNEVENVFYKIPSTTILNQLRNQDQVTNSGRLFISYSEPLSKLLTLNIYESVEMFKNKETITTYDFDTQTGDYTNVNQDFTNSIDRSGIRAYTTVGLNARIKQLSITPQLSFRILNIRNRFMKDNPIDQNFTNLFPSLVVRFRSFSINYNMQLSEPNATDLQPVTNNTNPLYITLGNPALKPAIAHSFSINSFKYIVKTGLNYNIGINSQIQRNSIVRARLIDENGVQTSLPVNVNGVWRSTFSASIRKQYKFSQQWKFSLGANFYTTLNNTQLILNDRQTAVRNWSVNPGANWSFNWADKIELNQRYSPSWTKNTYEDKLYPGVSVWRHTASTEFVVRLPKHWVWESSINYVYNPQVAPGIQKSVWLWNAGVNYLFLKDDRGQVKLSVYDLLDQNTSVFRTVRENYVQDQETIILQRYFLLTFTYNIRNFGAKVGGSNRLLIF